MNPARLLRGLGRIGWSEQDSEDVRLQKSVLAYNTALITVLALIWVGTYWSLGLYLSAVVPALYQLISVAGLVLFWRRKRFRLLRNLQLTAMLVLPFVLQWTLGGFVAGSAVGLWALIAPLGAMMLGARAVPWFGGFLTLLVVSALLEPGLPPAAVPAPLRLGFFVLNLGAPSLTAFVLLRYFLRQRDAAREAFAEEHRKLQIERIRSEQLLLNVLPAPIAERLKEGEHGIADIGEATVLFADIVDFTPLAHQQAPERVVDLLNDVFTWLDTVADRFGVEKIKTIGDAYMAVAGLPTPRVDHVTAIAETALAVVHTMPPFSRSQGEPLALRVGIDTGPVVAGVIGRRKFSYDLWGDTVNTASRMVTTGVPGRIQVTQRVIEALAGRYTFEPRGEIDVKGKGPMRTWFLLGQARPAESPRSATPAGLGDNP
jgi:adenylate cyclase